MLRYEVGKAWQIIQLHYTKWLGLKGRFKREYESVISKVYSRCALEVNLRISAYLLRISFSIGGRYSVRGFSGEETLRGDSGYYVQSEWSLPFRKQQITPYVGIDIGHVWGPSTETQLGTTLIGGVVGVRGTVGDAVNYDVSLGTPIKKPEGF